MSRAQLERELMKQGYSADQLKLLSYSSLESMLSDIQGWTEQQRSESSEGMEDFGRNYWKIDGCGS